MHFSAPPLRRLALSLGVAWVCGLSACAGPQAGVVWKHDAFEGTLAIGDGRYLVTKQSRLFGPDGDPIRLQDVPTASDPDVGVRHLERARVEFNSRQRGGQRYLDSLWLLEP